MPDETLDLNRQIAGELGYRAEQHPNGYRVNTWLIYDKDGIEVNPTDGAATEDNAWKSIFAVCDECPHLPSWAQSVDAALTLPIPDGGEWDFSLASRYAWVALSKDDGTYADGGPRSIRLGEAESGGKLAEAICRAWLAYRKSLKSP